MSLRFVRTPFVPVWVVLSSLLLSSCQTALFTPRPLRPLEDLDEDLTQLTLAINAPQFARLHGCRPAKAPSTEGSQQIRVVFPGGIEKVISVLAGEKLTQVIMRVTPTEMVPELSRVAVYRTGEPAFLVICDLKRRWRYGDLHEDVTLAAGDVVFIPYHPDFLIDEFFAAFGVLAVE